MHGARIRNTQQGLLPDWCKKCAHAKIAGVENGQALDAAPVQRHNDLREDENAAACTVFEQATNDLRVQVLKTYDRQDAREVFGGMNDAAQRYLWSSLGIDEAYDSGRFRPARPGEPRFSLGGALGSGPRRR